MKKEVMLLLLLGILLILPLVQAQTYSGFNKFSDSVKMFFSSGDKKVRLALEIREKEVNSALENFQNENKEEVTKNLEGAQDNLKLIQEKVSLNTSEEIKASVIEIKNKLNQEENLSNEFEEYLLEEEKTHLTAVLTEKTYEYCKELAKEDFSLMLKEEECNPKTAPEPLKDDLAKLKDLQERMFVQLMLEIRSCIDDPGTCNCENNVDIEQKAKCEKMVALAIKCEYKDDEASCNELESMKPKKGDSFAESFVPDFLMNLFKEKDYMVGYDLEPSCGVPKECWDENDKPECRQYDYLKETKDDWDEYGNYIGTKKECGTKGPIPTMQESIPQCFDENNNFLEEKCGKITMVENEEGLINYIIENELNGILGELETRSEENKIDKNNTLNEGNWTVDEGEQNANGSNWTVDEGGLKISNKAREIKQEMNEIKNQIVERTFAPGTYDTGDSTNDVKNVVVEGGGKGSGDNGLNPEVKTDIAGGGNSGESSVVIEGGKKEVVSGGHDKNDPLPNPDLNQINPDIAPTGRAPGDTIVDPDGEPTNTIDP